MEPNQRNLKVELLGLSITVELDTFIKNPTIDAIQKTTYLLFLYNSILSCPAIKAYPNIIPIVNSLFINSARTIPLLSRAIGYNVKSVVITCLTMFFDALLHTTDEKTYFTQIQSKPTKEHGCMKCQIQELVTSLNILSSSIINEYPLQNAITRIAESCLIIIADYTQSRSMKNNAAYRILKLINKLNVKFFTNRYTIGKGIPYYVGSFISLEHTNENIKKLSKFSKKYNFDVNKISQIVDTHYYELCQQITPEVVSHIIQYWHEDEDIEERTRKERITQILSIPLIDQYIGADACASKNLIVKLLFWFLLRKKDKLNFLTFSNSKELTELICDSLKITNKLINLSNIIDIVLKFMDKIASTDNQTDKIMNFLTDLQKNDKETSEWFLNKVKQVNTRAIIIATPDTLSEISSYYMCSNHDTPNRSKNVAPLLDAFMKEVKVNLAI